MNRQRVILFVLVILLAATVLWSYNAMPRHKTVAPTGNTPGQQAKQEAKQVLEASEKTTRVVDDGTILKINLLDKGASGFKGYRRNIFKPVLADEIKAVKRQAAAIIPPAKILPATVTATAPIAVQPETAPLARFTFLGFLKRGSVKTIFLAKEKDILLVKKGDVVAGRYEATDISDQALTLTVTDTGDEIVIPLIENKPLATVK